MKRWVVLAVGILIALIVLGMIKDLVIKVAVQSGVQIATGLKVRTGTFRVGLLNTLVDIKNLRLLNPPGFKDKNMLEMPEIYVAYDLPAIFGGKVHLKEARINMKEFVVVKNEKGALNLDSLNAVQAQKSGPASKQQKGGKPLKIQIDSLRLGIGKVTFKDYSVAGGPKVMQFDVNINEEYRNITDPNALVSLIVVKALMNTTIAKLTNFDIKGLSSSISDTLAGAKQAAAEATKKAQAAAMDTAKTAGDTVKKTEETVSKTADALSGAFKNPFGGDK